MIILKDKYNYDNNKEDTDNILTVFEFSMAITNESITQLYPTSTLSHIFSYEYFFFWRGGGCQVLKFYKNEANPQKMKIGMPNKPHR